MSEKSEINYKSQTKQNNNVARSPTSVLNQIKRAGAPHLKQQTHAHTHRHSANVMQSHHGNANRARIIPI